MSVCLNARLVQSTGGKHKCTVCDLCYVCHGCPDVDYESAKPRPRANKKNNPPTNMGVLADEEVQNLLLEIENDNHPRYIVVGPNNEIQDKSAQVVHLQKKTEVKKAKVLTYECNKCKKQFTSKKDLDIHDIYHATEDEHVCQVCYIRFDYSYELIKHMINHKYPCFVCPYCKKEFDSAERRKLHTRKHTGEKLFDCEICGKSFLEKSTLKSHGLTHSDIRPFKCKECARAFKSKHKLDQHNLIHEGIMPFICHVCEKKFRHKCNLSTHLKQHVVSDDEDDLSDCFVVE